MTQKTWKTLSLLLILTITAVIIWACSGTEQQTTTTTTAEPVAAVATDTAVVAATATPALIATTVSTDTAATSPEAATASTTTSDATTASVQLFTIDQSQSTARFTLNEELLGSPKTVVGATNLVSGAITIDPTDITKSTISPIQIDARGIATDSERRDGAIRRFVLGSNSDENRYIVFTPTAITGFPTAVAVGDTFELQVTGDLTISGVTKAETFVTSVTVTSETQITGLATVQVLRSDYNLTIPSVPSVANVTDEVLLELQFVATA